VLQVLSIAAGGAAGALVRWSVSLWIHGLLGPGFPYGTLAVNVAGSFAMGVLYVVLGQRLEVAPELRLALTVGFLGAFTTFSTFSMETIGLLEDGRFPAALLNVSSSIALCLGGCWLGLIAARHL
jgi:CrcB protein